jgi:hypothetical protein
VVEDLQDWMGDAEKKQQDVMDMFDLQSLLKTIEPNQEHVSSRTNFEHYSSPRLMVRLERMLGESFRPEAVLYHPNADHKPPFKFDGSRNNNKSTQRKRNPTAAVKNT